MARSPPITTREREMVKMEGPYEGLLRRFWETLERSGIGMLRPWQIRRVGKAKIDVERSRRLVEAQTRLDIDAILAGQKVLADDGEALLEAAHSDARLVQDAAVLLAERAIVRDELRSQVNVAKALLVAEAELHNDPQEPPDKEVDDDWFFRWRKLVGEVGAEQLQALWGRVLAGEIRSPGAFSLRTLEFLKNLSQSEAQLIEKIGPFVINGEMLVLVESGDPDILEHEGVTFVLRLRLEELGILSSREKLTRRMPSNVGERFESYLESHGRVVLLRHENPRQELVVSAHRLTDLGSQVVGIGSFEPHEGYLRHIGESIKEKGFEVAIADVGRVTGSMFSYENAVEL